MTNRLASRPLLLGLLLLPRVSAAFSDGSKVVGNSGLSAAQTCSKCHFGGTAPKPSFAGPATLTPGQTATYTFSLQSDGVKGGVDIAVDDAHATLAAVSPTVQLVMGEIVHKSAIDYTNGELVVSFTVTAPPTTGTVTLYGWGIRAGLFGLPWAAAGATYAITVQGGSGGNADGGTGIPDAGDPGNGGTATTVPDAGSAPAKPPATNGGCSAVAGLAPSAANLSVLLLVGLGLSVVALRRRHGRARSQ
jgi:hypothetical protein